MGSADPRDTKLQDVDDATSKVNSGNEICLNCTNIKASYNAAVSSPTIVGQDTATTAHNSLLPKSDFISVTSMEIIVEGIIDLAETRVTTTINSVTSTIVTLKILQQIVKSGHKFKLTDLYDEDVTKYRISTLSGTFPNETAGEIYVMALGLEVNSSTKSALEGQRLDYILRLKEVQN